MTARLWINQNGRLSCDDHGGSYLRSEREAFPRRRVHRTPLDLWEAITEEDRKAWTIMAGEAPECEDCRAAARRKA